MLIRWPGRCQSVWLVWRERRSEFAARDGSSHLLGVYAQFDVAQRAIEAGQESDWPPGEWSYQPKGEDNWERWGYDRGYYNRLYPFFWAERREIE